MTRRLWARGRLEQHSERGPTGVVVMIAAAILAGWISAARGQPDRVPEAEAELQVPPLVRQEPQPGKRVRMTFPEFSESGLHHALYLPTDWQPGLRYPVIVEYPGNQWREYPGTVEGCSLGYGISGGEGVIWLCLPMVDLENRSHSLTWWGDVHATVAYCKRAVQEVCTRFGGDPDRLFLAGFSRGSIACNFIGLHDDEIAALWCGFICHSHYDGVREWNYPGSNREAARERLRRLAGRPQFISHEGTVEPTRRYLLNAGAEGNFTFLSMSFAEHTDRWVLRETEERAVARAWFHEQTRPGDTGSTPP